MLHTHSLTPTLVSAVAHPIRPKPPSATSIPAILKALQDEWVSTQKQSGFLCAVRRGEWGVPSSLPLCPAFSTGHGAQNPLWPHQHPSYELCPT